MLKQFPHCYNIVVRKYYKILLYLLQENEIFINCSFYIIFSNKNNNGVK